MDFKGTTSNDSAISQFLNWLGSPGFQPFLLLLLGLGLGPGYYFAVRANTKQVIGRFRVFHREQKPITGYVEKGAWTTSEIQLRTKHNPIQLELRTHTIKAKSQLNVPESYTIKLRNGDDVFWEGKVKNKNPGASIRSELDLFAVKQADIYTIEVTPSPSDAHLEQVNLLVRSRVFDPNFPIVGLGIAMLLASIVRMFQVHTDALGKVWRAIARFFGGISKPIGW